MLREHSTFFGFASALVCAIVAGSVSHWSPIWMAAIAIAGIFFFPRYFYGFKEARALRDADFELGSGKSVSWYVEPPPNQLNPHSPDQLVNPARMRSASAIIDR